VRAGWGFSVRKGPFRVFIYWRLWSLGVAAVVLGLLFYFQKV
jgi:hypothetical protein